MGALQEEKKQDALTKVYASKEDIEKIRRKREDRSWSTGPTRPEIEEQKEETNHWMPWPYKNHEQICYYLGWLVLLIPGPFMGVLIGSGELSMAILKFFWTRLPLDIPNKIKLFIKNSSEAIGKKVLRDQRDAPFLPHMIWLSIWTPLIFLFAAYRYYTHGFELWFFFAYHFLRIGPRFRFFAHLHVLVHREGHYHQGIFNKQYSILNGWLMQWHVGQFFGQVPNSYGMAHNKIHHKYDNGLDDVHTNLDLDRSKFSSFVIYVPRFLAYWSGVSPLIHFIYHKEYTFAKKMAKGMIYYYGVMAILLYINWVFALAFFIFPFFEATIFFAGISYMWHCWVDPEDPYNPYVSSVTILDGHDNIWNEDYHVVHHDAVSVHWSLAPAHFEKHRDQYAKHGATVFQDTEEGAMLFWMLSGNWDELAKHYVDFSGKLTHEEKKALLLKRARYIIKPKNS